MRKLKLDELNRLSVSEFKSAERIPVVVVLDNIRSALNVGSIFRTCDAFAVEKLFLCGITAKPPHKEINKTAIGATDSVNWEYAGDITTLAKELKESSYKLIGVEQTDKSVKLQDYKPESKQARLALIFGNEVQGLSGSLLPLLDDALEVPQYGTKHSINVAVCAGVVIWDILKKYRFDQYL